MRLPHTSREGVTHTVQAGMCTQQQRIGKETTHNEDHVATTEMLATCCTHIAISDNMSLMGLTTSMVNAVQKFQKKSGGNCGNCTKSHSPGRQHCPAQNSTCSFCHKQGHWIAKCRKAKKSKPGTKRPHNPQQQYGHRKGGGQKTNEVGVSEGDPHCDEIAILA